MRKFSLIIFALILTMLAVFPAAAQSATPEATPDSTPDGQVAITLQRTACFGTCPVYTVTIYTDGTVLYNGEQFVTVKGEQTYSIDPATVQQLVEGFAAVGYFDWNDEYKDMHITDMPYITTSVTRDGVTKQIERYAGDDSAPLTLPLLEAWIDRVAQTEQWTGVDPRNNSVGVNAPVITLDRTACNGICPIYSLNLFADGTVVYVGADHVAVTGMQVTKVDAAVVESLVQQAKAIGYFGWNDEYTDFVMTDQSTVFTSVSSEDDGYKGIARYDGDPNAPIGLVRFEDRIDAAVNVDQWVKAPDQAQ